MESIDSEETLISRLKEDVHASHKERIVFVAGHFSVNYESGRAYEDFAKWGDFSRYSLDLACKVACEARTNEKKVSFALIADDLLCQETAEKAGLNRRQLSSWRNLFYEYNSGTLAYLPPLLGDVLRKYHFDENNILRHNHGKEGRTDCLYIAEKVLRDQRKGISGECAKAYLSFLENPELLDKRKDYLVAFIPDRCTGNICNKVLDQEVDGLSASHVFMQTDSTFLGQTSPSDLWQNWGVLYRKD